MMPHVVDPGLTKAWCEVYEAMRQAWTDFGVGPSQSELCKATGYSAMTIRDAFRNLRANGHIVAPKYGARTAKPVDLERTISISEELAPKPWDSPKQYWKEIQ